jgi:acyl phosphate:glycerol-3-phosphate acyltransferase
MITLDNILAFLAAYLIGSIPSAVWIGKYFYGIDVREYGSGNSGATNTFRVLGKKAGLPVLLLDMLKGWAAVNLAYITGIFQTGSDQFYNLQMAMAIAALAGHLFPVFAGFRGGKGVATMLGIIIALHPMAALICLGVFFIVFLLTQYVSLSSMITGLCFPFVIMLLFHNSVVSINIFAMFVSILILVTHQKNIERLIRGEESKINLLKFRK